MSYALVLLTGTCLAGGPVDAASCHTCSAPATAIKPVDYTIPSRPGPLAGIRDRLRNIFYSSEVPVQEYHLQPAVPANSQNQIATQPIPSTEALTARPELQVSRQNQNRIGHADDYSWVTGQLFRVHTAAGTVWLLRYASLGEEDRFGGGVILSGSIEMKNYREADLVSVNGEILDGGRRARHLGAPLYRARFISMIERSDPDSLR